MTQLDAGVTATELYTHLGMLRRRTNLESPAVNSFQRDKVMSVGGNDLFGPNARKVQQWKKDTKEEKVKLISRVFDERGRMTSPQRRSQLLLLSVLLALYLTSLLWMHCPLLRSQDSYRRPPGQSFQKDSSQKHSSYKAWQPASSSKGFFQSEDKKPSSQSNFRSGGRGQGPPETTEITKDLSSLIPSTRKGGWKWQSEKVGQTRFRWGGS